MPFAVFLPQTLKVFGIRLPPHLSTLADQPAIHVGHAPTKPPRVPDIAEFYSFPRPVTHIDDGAIAAVTQVYRDTFPAGGVVLDLMSSWVRFCQQSCH